MGRPREGRKLASALGFCKREKGENWDRISPHLTWPDSGGRCGAGVPLGSPGPPQQRSHQYSKSLNTSVQLSQIYLLGNDDFLDGPRIAMLVEQWYPVGPLKSSNVNHFPGCCRLQIHGFPHLISIAHYHRCHPEPSSKFLLVPWPLVLFLFPYHRLVLSKWVE